MQITCWTIADGGKLPTGFPSGALQGARLLVTGKDLHSDSANFAACLNEASRIAGNGLLVTLPPDLAGLTEDWQKLLTAAAEKNIHGCFFYGDYFVRDKTGDKLQTLRADLGDVTEREDWGPVWAVRAEWLNSIGGVDEQNSRAAFYDLLLKTWGSHQRVYVHGPLGTVTAPEADAEQSQLKDKLFFPGRGALGGFSYLFLDKEEERQIEQVFYNFLKREKAWLEGARSAIPRSPETSKPIVSVVTPVYNRALFIGLAIESVQRQTLTDWEYIIVDNGSTDSTQDVVKHYASKDPRIRLIQNNQNVIALALNIGVRHAQGKYIAQLDSDDEYLPQTLTRMTEALESNPTWGLAISYYELMDEAGNSLPEFGIIRHEQYNRNNILRRDGAGALRCWHKSVIEEFGGFDEKELGHYGEDYDLVLKCGEKYEVGRVQEVCYRYRRHGGNTDVLRAHEMKIKNKTIARLNALKRRKELNS